MTGRPAPRVRLGSVVFVVWLVFMWILLWGEFSLANVVGGVLVATVLLIAVPRPKVHADTPHVRPLAVVSLVGWFLWKLFEANLKVALEVVRPPGKARIDPAIVAIPLPGCPDGVTTAVANFITLTPGTLTVEVDPQGPVLFVHVMQFESTEGTRAEVYEIERRIVAAVGTAAAREASAGREVAS
jgi:multicomponent Na+:H+ antiporter subunit E